MQKQPNSRYCFVCGLENDHGLHLHFYNTGPDTVEVSYSVPDHFQGYPGIVHGGIVASMLDEVLGRVFMIDDPDRFMYTAKLTTRYRKNVPTETPLRVRGQVVKDRGRTAEAKAYIFGPGEELLAEADGLLVTLPEEVLGKVNKDQLGWRVYPEKEVPL